MTLTTPRSVRPAWLAAIRDFLIGPPAWVPASAEGRRGELVARRYLSRRAYRVIGKNIRTLAGEADLLCIAPDRITMVIVEVKSRTLRRGESAAAIPPEASVTREKRLTLQRVARLLARANAWENRPWRIDVVGVEFPAGGKPVVRHTQDLRWL